MQRLFCLFIFVVAIFWKCCGSRNFEEADLRSAFCNKYDIQSAPLFPTSPPSPHLPWVWDAVYNSDIQSISVIYMTRKPCNFNVTLWRRMFINSHPMFAKDLAYGNLSNILVPIKIRDNGTPLVTFDEVISQVLVCQFFENNRMVNSSLASKFNGIPHTASIGFAVLHCPLPLTLISNLSSLKMRITTKTKVPTISPSSMNPLLSSKELSHANVTDLFSFCHSSQSPLIPTGFTSHATSAVAATSIETQYQYGLSICTATMHFDRNILVEWLEYHFTMGVDHVYLYITSTNITHFTHLRAQVRDYLTEGKVTLIPWPYENCVRGMASGRMGYFQDQTVANASTEYFQPPRAIAQSAALASCYLRFKHTSQYMSHIDLDEFLSLKYVKYYPIKDAKTNVHWQRNDRLSLKNRNLYLAADAIFQAHPESSALRFAPLWLSKCVKNASTRNSFAEKARRWLPRLSHVGVASNQTMWFESKLLWRTDRVDMFFVHYLTQLTQQTPSTSAFNPRIETHYFYVPLGDGLVWHLRQVETLLSGKTSVFSPPYDRMLIDTPSYLSQHCSTQTPVSIMRLYNLSDPNSSGMGHSKHRLQQNILVRKRKILKPPAAHVETVSLQVLRRMGHSLEWWQEIVRRIRLRLSKTLK